ncbi:MYCBP-associated protein family [Popillia japonica]|uniref:MYCBP-associated protein family n=1 Tax=Popillia japonica TaxID=7064 RepID=A0AAW1ID05_POPJA
MSFSDLPFSSKVVCLCGKSDKRVEQHKIDPRLSNWEKWMKKRKESTLKIAKALDRHTEQLLCNYSEDLRTIKEEKEVLENTKIIYPHDRYRGNPSFWSLPLALHSKPCQPDYFSVMTSAQKCEIPTMEYVFVPTEIRNEKSVQNFGYRNEKKVWDASQYRQERTSKLEEKIKIVEPFKPDLDIMVKGISIISECDECTKTAKSCEFII